MLYRGGRLCSKSVGLEDQMERYAKYVGPIVMTFMVVFFVTGFITWLNVGVSDDFIMRWVRGWLFGWPIAALAVITLAPVGNAITNFIVRKLS